MNVRELRGKEIAEKARIRQNSRGLWLVPSQSGHGDYSVKSGKC
jgi:hypothetical protein